MLICMEPVFFQQAQCPYCGEFIDLEVDSSGGEQSYIEDCSVGCRPIEVRLSWRDDDWSLEVGRVDQ